MEVALDTNRLTDLFRGDDELAVYLNRCDKVWVPLVVLGEIMAGFLGGRRRASNEAELEKFLSRRAVSVLIPGLRTAELYASVSVQLKRAGTPIPDNDVWIAALALEYNLVLVTRDKHFRCIPQLPLG